MKRQFTATAYILDGDQILLIRHRKLGKWLPPGGHIDLNETPPEAAKREVLEETGLEIEFIHQENFWVDRWNAKSIERPYMCLLENIPPHGDHPAHQHIDMIFLARVVGGNLQENPSETSGIHWFTAEDLDKLEPDKEIFSETLEVIRGLLHESPLLESHTPAR